MIASVANNAGWIGVGLITCAVLAIIYQYAPQWWAAHMKRRHSNWRASQETSVREIALKNIVQNILRKGIEDAVNKQEVSQQERTKMYAWLQVQLGMPDLVAGRKDPNEVKQRLKSERAQRENKHIHGFKAGK